MQPTDESVHIKSESLSSPTGSPGSDFGVAVAKDQNLNASSLPTVQPDWTNNAWSNVIPKILQIEQVQQLDTSALSSFSNPSGSTLQLEATKTGLCFYIFLNIKFILLFTDKNHFDFY